MTSRKALKGVLHNFLGTYTSRYSSYEGYWLFGMLVGDAIDLHIDLLSPTIRSGNPNPVRIAIKLAAALFRDQMKKARVAVSCVRVANLDIIRLPDSQHGTINGCVCAGYSLRFLASVMSDSGRKYVREMVLFVAPHDPRVEWRSNPIAAWFEL
jgi:hypothetical protein